MKCLIHKSTTIFVIFISSLQEFGCSLGNPRDVSFDVDKNKREFPMCIEVKKNFFLIDNNLEMIFRAALSSFE